MKTDLFTKSINYLEKLCSGIPERCVGSEGNRQATAFFANRLTELGWNVEAQEFNAIDWKEEGTELLIDKTRFQALASPYSKGCEARAILASAGSLAELESGSFTDKIILLHSEIASEQLMPKNFVFYNPEHHQKIVSLLENSGARALICATGRNTALAGGVYPFPLIEDGDFDIPSVYMTEEEGEKLLRHDGREVYLRSVAERIPAKGYNVAGIKGSPGTERVVITAHIDAKKGSPGAIDNATGIVVLLLLAELLKDYDGNKTIELVAFNGEDYYAVPGQMAYITKNHDRFDDILLNINIDGAGFKEGKTAFSLFGLPDNLLKKARETFGNHPDFVEGPQWPQGDHSIFVQYGRPAIAITSQWFIENMETQDITHTPKDNPGIVDCRKPVAIAEALQDFIQRL